MAIRHAAVKASGETGLASEWNADHVVTGANLALRSRTKIIAANNSLDKERADYVCDGTADEVQINTAITALAGLGGTVILLEGTFTIASSIILSNNITLAGQGRGTKITTTEDIIMISAANKTGITISNLYIISGTASRGISFSTVALSIIKGCWVEGVYMNLLDLGVCTGVMIEGNFLIDGGTDGIFLDACERLVIASNIITDCATGIDLWGSNRCVISGNRTNLNAFDGILIADAPSTRNLVHGNISPDGITDNGTLTTVADNVTA